MTAPTTAPVELSHAEREAAAWNAYLAALNSADKEEVLRLFRVFADIHKQWPPSVVEAMEERMHLR